MISKNLGTNKQGLKKLLETNNIDYQQFASSSNFVDFGDLTTDFRNCAGLSNGHGGLG